MADKPIIVDGIKVSITLDDIDDLEFAELMEAGSIASALKMAFGEDEYKRIKEAFKEKHGKAKLSDVSEWFGKVAQELGANAKN